MSSNYNVIICIITLVIFISRSLVKFTAWWKPSSWFQMVHVSTLHNKTS